MSAPEKSGETPEKKEETKEETKEEVKEKKPDYTGQPIQKGDLIKLDLMGRTRPTATEKHIVTFEASNLEDAKKLPNYDPEKASLYTPELAIVGEKGFILDKLDEELPSMKFGEEKWVSLEPKDAFGERDPKKIEKMSFKKFVSLAKEKPRLGMEFKDDKGRHGHVVYADQGRIRVDFNHILAGRPVEYKLKPLEKIEKFEDKVFAFLGRRMQGIVPELFKIDYQEKENILNIEVPQYYALQQNMGYAEFSASYELQQYLNVDTVNFIHSFKKQPVPTPPAGEHVHDHEHDHEHDHTQETVEKSEDSENSEKDSKETKKKTTKKSKKSAKK